MSDIGQDMAMPRTNNKNEGAVRRMEVVDKVDVMKKIIDESTAGTTYICTAKPGTAEATAAWQIQKIVEAASVTTITWADGDGKFDNVAADRASLTYR